MLGRGHDLSFVWESARYVPYDSFGFFFHLYIQYISLCGRLFTSTGFVSMAPKDVWYRGARSTSNLLCRCSAATSMCHVSPLQCSKANRNAYRFADC